MREGDARKPGRFGDTARARYLARERQRRFARRMWEGPSGRQSPAGGQTAPPPRDDLHEGR
jgi:hypothetical protein